MGASAFGRDDGSDTGGLLLATLFGLGCAGECSAGFDASGGAPAGVRFAATAAVSAGMGLFVGRAAGWILGSTFGCTLG
jgi:hypothetical protein